MNLREPEASPELLIITPSLLRSSATKLSNHKQSMGVKTAVANLDEIYQSFGYGNPDLTAIRNYIAYTYQSGKTLKNVLILGKGTFDYKAKLGGRPISFRFTAVGKVSTHSPLSVQTIILG